MKSLETANQCMLLRKSAPVILRARPQWLLWKYQHRQTCARAAKVPYQPNGWPAKTNDSQTWSSFEDCLQALSNASFDGIGFVFADGDGLVGIDIDSSIDSAGVIFSWAEEIVDKFPDTYIERSPSGGGLHIICIGEPVKSGKQKSWFDQLAGVKHGVEVYNFRSPRYFTFSGDVVQARGVKNSQSGLVWLHENYFAEPGRAKPRYADALSTVREECARSKALPDAPAEEEVVRALHCISPDCGYSEWLRIGMSLHSCGFDFSIWDSWSKGSVKYMPGECQRKWGSFRGSGVKIATLFYYAYQNGFSRSNHCLMTVS